MTNLCGVHDLIWSEPDDRRHAYTLRMEGKETGWLHFDEQAEDRATGELAGRHLRFEPAESQVPFPSVVVRENEAVIATFTQRWNGGGTVAFTSGARYCWNPVHIWSSTWCFRREGSDAAVCVSQQAFPLQSGGKVRCCSESVPAEEAQVLVLLGWYLRVMSRGLQAETIIP